MADACEFLPEFKHLTAKFKSGHATVYDRFCNAAACNPNGFNVLAHGDMWSNNIMFQRDPETRAIKNALFVDFQMSWITSPMLDIVYSFFTSSHADLIEIHWEELIHYYHEELVAMLAKLSYSGRKPRLIDFHAEMLTRGTLGVMYGLFVLALRSLQDAPMLDIKRVLSVDEDDREYRRDLMLMPECRRGLEFMLRYSDRKGLLDDWH